MLESDGARALVKADREERLVTVCVHSDATKLDGRRRDAKQHDALVVRLKPMVSEGLVDTWSDRCLVAGQPWDDEIRRELDSADVILFLLSAQFEASGYIQGVEVKRALERAEKGEVQLVPIILEPCGW